MQRRYSVSTVLLVRLCDLSLAHLVISSVFVHRFYVIFSYLRVYIVHICAGLFPAASNLLCGLTFDVAHSSSHVILLKYLADAGEVPIAIEHVNWVRETSPSMLQMIRTELSASLSSSSKPEPILQLLQKVQEISILNQ